MDKCIKGTAENIGHPYIVDSSSTSCYALAMTRAREQIISLDDTPYYHCMARCVRRAYLFGEDSVTGRRFDHRKAWVVDKLAFLSEVFAIDVCAYAVMSNHYHVVLHVNQPECDDLSVDEVIERWTSLFSGNSLVSRYTAGNEMTKAELSVVYEFAEQWRLRLKDISWFMRVLNESIARMANEEDDCKGRFWEGRFKSQALLDEAAVLACMAYVDLNPIRAGIDSLPENSDYTSIQQRIQAFGSRKVGRPKKVGKNNKTNKGAESLRNKPVLFQFNHGVDLQDGEQGLAFSLQDYLELIDWTGRAVRPDKTGSIPEHVPKILARLSMTSKQWLKFVPDVEKKFTHAVGAKERLKELAAKFDKAWFHGQGLTKNYYSV